MRKYNLQLIILWISFILLLSIIIFFLYRPNIIKETSERLTILIASIGILFSITQLFSNNINKNIAFLRQIRYDEYKRVRALMHRFFDSISGAMNKELDVYTLVHKLTTTKNELATILNVNNKTIFYGIHNNKSVKEFGEISDEIIIRTDQLRSKTDKLNNSQEETLLLVELEIEKMNWHNEIIEKVEKLHNLKYELLGFIENKTIS